MMRTTKTIMVVFLLLLSMMMMMKCVHIYVIFVWYCTMICIPCWLFINELHVYVFLPIAPNGGWMVCWQQLQQRHLILQFLITVIFVDKKKKLTKNKPHNKDIFWQISNYSLVRVFEHLILLANIFTPTKWFKRTIQCYSCGPRYFFFASFHFPSVQTTAKTVSSFQYKGIQTHAHTDVCVCVCVCCIFSAFD